MAGVRGTGSDVMENAPLRLVLCGDVTHEPSKRRNGLAGCEILKPVYFHPPLGGGGDSFSIFYV